MARIWPVYEGRDPTRGEPWADIPVSEAISLFELKPNDLVSDFPTTPRFGNVDRDLGYRGYKLIVVEIGLSEDRPAKWKPGFYRSRVKPKDAFEKLIQKTLVPALGAENVVRVEFEPTTDSQDHDALRITVVIAPGATEKLAKDASLSALVRLQEWFSEMREDRTPIIEYATEAELAQDGTA